MSLGEESAMPIGMYTYTPDGYRVTHESTHGLSKREYIAVAAMHGLVAHPESQIWTYDGIAKSAVEQADALLAALSAAPPAPEGDIK